VFFSPFQLQYSINPWMNMHRTVDKGKAMEQWENLKATLEQCGAQVDVLDPVVSAISFDLFFLKVPSLFWQNADRYPDIVFTANAAVLRGKRAYMANFFHPERKGERFFYEQWFQVRKTERFLSKCFSQFQDNGFETVHNLDIPFEGAARNSKSLQLNISRSR
jgi:N-dimethylarginine dimethylaminohydrolase